MQSKVEEFVKERAMIEHGQTLKVEPLWDGRFRANVWQSDPKTQIVASFFIHTSDGRIIYSNPCLGAEDLVLVKKEESKECQSLEI